MQGVRLIIPSKLSKEEASHSQHAYQDVHLFVHSTCSSPNEGHLARQISQVRNFARMQFLHLLIRIVRHSKLNVIMKLSHHRPHFHFSLSQPTSL
jgi:hypothetical protein